MIPDDAKLPFKVWLDVDPEPIEIDLKIITGFTQI